MTESIKKPVLFVDVDGVISLFGFPPSRDKVPGEFHWIEGVAHCIPSRAGARLVRLSERFDLVWATGWEDKANEYLPFILKLPFRDLPSLSFDGQAVFGSSHWKLDAIESYAGDQPVAWIDDNLGDACRLWALSRRGPDAAGGDQVRLGHDRRPRRRAAALGRHPGAAERPSAHPGRLS